MIVPLFHYQIFGCSTIRCSPFQSSDVPLFHHQMFHFSTIIVQLFLPQMVHCSTIRCSTVPLSDVLLFHYPMFYCSTSEFSLFHHLCFTDPPFTSSTVLPFLFLCSTITCSTVPPSLFNHFPSTLPLSDVLLFHHQIVDFPP